MLNSLWNETASTLRHAPEIALFLSRAIGYAVGKIPIGSVTLGPTVSTLLAAVAIGQIGITVDPLIKAVLFALFISPSVIAAAHSSSPASNGRPDRSWRWRWCSRSPRS